MKSFNTDEGFSQNYKFLIGAIVPRPIAIVSTKNMDGTDNLAPFSFFTAVSSSPMIIAFSPMIRSSDGQRKDTVINIEKNKEFVINFCTEEIARQVNLTASDLPYGQSEFEYAGLTPISSELIAPMRIKESPIHFECQLRNLIYYGNKPGNGALVTGEVIKVHVKEEILVGGRIDTDLYNPIGRGAGAEWIRTNNRITLPRE